MNTLLRRFSLAFLCLLPSLALAADPVFKYKGEITGVSCAACSKHVKTALEKLPGVSSVKVIITQTEGLAKLEINSTSEKITKETATAALGKDAKSYQIQELQLEAAK